MLIYRILTFQYLLKHKQIWLFETNKTLIRNILVQTKIILQTNTNIFWKKTNGIPPRRKLLDSIRISTYTPKRKENGRSALLEFYDRPFTSRLYCSPRGKTVIIQYRALSAYHRLAFPGLCISILQLANCFNLIQTMVASSSPVITDSDGDPTLLWR